MNIFTQIGLPLKSFGSGTQNPQLESGNLGDLFVSELEGRFYSLAYNNMLFGGGHTAALSLVAANATATSLAAAAQPVLGLWNPTSGASAVNLVVLQAALQEYLNNVTSVALGDWVWAVATAQTAISTGAQGFSRSQLTASSKGKFFAGATALTGLVGSMTIMESAEIPQASGLLTTTVAASTPTPSAGACLNIDGGIIVPPGGVLALMNTLAVTTHSVYGRLLWAEVPV